MAFLVTLFEGKKTFEEHKCYIIHNIEPVKEFGWLVPIFGSLHLEMNLGRAFIKLNWDIFVKSVGVALGFETPKSQAYLYKGSDHHKMWHLIEILYCALTLDGYWTWSKDTSNPNYTYIQHAAFSQLQGLMTLRAGMTIILLFNRDRNNGC